MKKVGKNLQELSNKIRNLPEQYRRPLMDSLEECLDEAKRRTRIYEIITESLEDVRLDVKYLQFDLDATRRERDEAINANF